MPIIFPMNARRTTTAVKTQALVPVLALREHHDRERELVRASLFARPTVCSTTSGLIGLRGRPLRPRSPRGTSPIPFGPPDVPCPPINPWPLSPNHPLDSSDDSRPCRLGRL